MPADLYFLASRRTWKEGWGLFWFSALPLKSADPSSGIVVYCVDLYSHEPDTLTAPQALARIRRIVRRLRIVFKTPYPSTPGKRSPTSGVCCNCSEVRRRRTSKRSTCAAAAAAQVLSLQSRGVHLFCDPVVHRPRIQAAQFNLHDESKLSLVGIIP